MLGGQRPSVDGELEFSTESIGLTDFDPGALAHVVSGAEFEHRRLQGGDSEINLLHCRLPHSVIDRGIYSPSVLVNGTFASDAITMGTMLRQREATIVNGAEMKMGTVQFYAEKSEMCYRAWPNATWFAFVIPRERLLEFITEELGAEPDLPRFGSVSIEPKFKHNGDQFVAQLRDLDRSLRHLSSTQNAARLGQALENELLAGIATFFNPRPRMNRIGDRLRLRQCREIFRDVTKLIESDPAEMFDLRSMSTATGLSSRTLQRAFQAEYGLCPQQWLKVERLNRVRQDLLSKENTNSVTDVATKWGFFHLGRFSRYYWELFRERPSETLGRSATE